MMYVRRYILKVLQFTDCPQEHLNLYPNKGVDNVLILGTNPPLEFSEKWWFVTENSEASTVSRSMFVETQFVVRMFLST